MMAYNWDKMNTEFTLIQELSRFLAPVDIPWFVSGGWAIDVHLGRVTRARGDLDISIPHADRLACIEFFLSQGWQVEGKLGGGFKTIQALSDYEDAIHYFWSFPKGADFIGEFKDEGGNRRIDYRRDTQAELDYIEVFFDRIENGYFIYRREPGIKRRQAQAILEKEGVRYLAPEVVLLFKSTHLSEKNHRDLNVVRDSLDQHARAWLVDAMWRIYEDSHPWLAKFQDGRW